ncbi:ROK family transcriptional regulator [Bombiscardovia coagulans]|uniref:Glucokinase/xylose repressor n=1 Tax=Bombiscardovia coagulans TaxID=686666 RepID=A0A261EQ43_9BIFI|nr:ROK family transcriptional regulator [Bombiscardovia coagulans]OZG48967.1 glucokinase/xylose repressor [Bombiscardovia coagulans]
MAHRLFGSQTSLREANRVLLLDTIRRFGAMTQIELAENTGLSTATVSNLVRQMSDQGLLETSVTTHNGRRATLVMLTRQKGIGAGLYIGRRDMRLEIIDSSHTILSEHNLPLPNHHKPDTTIERAVILIGETLTSIGARADELVGLDIALGAPVDCRTHQLAIPGILKGWDNQDVKGAFAEALNVPVNVDNDANYAALVELRLGAATGKRHFVYVQANDGVGAGIVMNSEIWRGTTGLAGEIGHVQVDPLGDICICGNRGCLNTVVNENRLVSLLSVTHGAMNMESLVGSVNKGDPGCRRIVADAAIRIGNVVADLCNAVDPQVVILGGMLSATGSVFLDPLQETLQRMLFPDAMVPMEVLPARYPITGSALGAAMMAVDRVNEHIAVSTKSTEQSS